MLRCRRTLVAFIVLAEACGTGTPSKTRGMPPEASPSPVPPAGPSLDLDEVRPYFAGPSHRALREAVATGDLTEARRLIAGLDVSDPTVARAARIVAAWARRDLPPSDAPGLVDELLALAEEEALLAPYLTLWAAERALRDGDLRRGEEIAAKIPAGTTVEGRARLTRADAAYAERDYPRAEALYRAHVEEGKGPRLLGATLRLAQCIAARPLGPARAVEAATLAVDVRVSSAGGPAGRAAQEVVQRVSSHLPQEVRRAYQEPGPAERAASAERLYQRHRSAEAERAWRELADELPADDPLRCRARLRVAQSVRKQREHARAAERFADAVDACQGRADRVEALYFGARSLEAAGDDAGAISRFAQVEEEFPDHSYADDARLRRAELLLEAGDEEGFRSSAETLPDDYPEGDMRGEALFRLAFWARRKGTLPEALRYLDEHLARIPREDGYKTAGRTLYWRGRVLRALGRRDEAVESWRRAFREYPLSFYAVLAHSRIEEIDPAVARTLRDEIGTSDEAEDWRFPLDETTESEGFRRGVELLRLGLRDDAMVELSSLGISAEDAPAEQRWLYAVLVALAGDPRGSHDFVRRNIHGWQRHPPVGSHRKKWLLAYPRLFGETAASAAEAERLPADLLLAIMREESAFDPRVESWANAVGLMQLIRPTARRFAVPLELPHGRQALRRPEVNVRIGAAFVRFLSDEFHEALPLVVAGYNAGENAVARWLGDCPQPGSRAIAVDELVESIPYDETRGYTKRVLSSFAVYRFLADGAEAIPRIPNGIPRPECATTSPP